MIIAHWRQKCKYIIVKKILKILLLFIILGTLFFQFEAPLRARLMPFINRVITQLGIFSPPCQNPITYTLGTFDAQFGISKSYFLKVLGEAEKIWEKPFGKELFAYEEDGEGDGMLKINLVYDYRQQATDKLASLGIAVKDNRASYDSLKIKLTELKTKFTAAKSDYDARVKSFNDQQKSFEEQVKYWNAQGGAPRKVYDEIQLKRSALEIQSSELQVLQTQINEMVSEINALVVVLNRLASTLNISVDTYNTIGASRGESFEEGVYSSDGLNRGIDIYEFSSRDKLVRVLAHELGHALDLDHVEDTKAIMYKLNQGNNKILTESDLDALKIKCGVK